MTKAARYNLYFTIAGVVTLALLIALFSIKTEAVNYAETARGVDVYLVTSQTKVSVSEFTTANVVITNDGTPLNAMEVEVYFDPRHFSVAEFTFGKDLCNEQFIIDNVIDNDNGRLHMSCGTTEPFSGSATIFGTITALPKTAGLTEFNFGEHTHVYIHDGLGTEIVRNTYDTTLVVESEA